MFYSESFTFDGKQSEQIQVVSTTGDILNEIGLKYSRSVSRDEGSTINPTYTTQEDEPDEITIEFVHIDPTTNRLLKWDETTINEVKRWFITDYFAPFMSADNPGMIYYLKCTGITKKLTNKFTGILEVTFKPLTHYAYKQSSVYISSTSRGSATTVNVNNPSHLPYRPVLKITKNDNQIYPITINEMEIRNVPNGTVLYIDNEMMVCNDDKGNDYFASLFYYGTNEDTARDSVNWIELQPGNNEIRVTGICTIEVLAEFPILL